MITISWGFLIFIICGSAFIGLMTMALIASGGRADAEQELALEKEQVKKLEGTNQKLYDEGFKNGKKEGYEEGRNFLLEEHKKLVESGIQLAKGFDGLNEFLVKEAKEIIK